MHSLNSTKHIYGRELSKFNFQAAKIQYTINIFIVIFVTIETATVIFNIYKAQKNVNHILKIRYDKLQLTVYQI